MHGPEMLIPLFAIFFLFGGPVVAFIITRVLAHQERIAMIQRGFVPPPRGFGGRSAYRQWAQNQPPGQPWNAAPQAPYVAPGCGDDDDPQRALYKGIRLALIGLAIFIGLSFIGGTPGSPEFRGGPWLLGGLIPMFVGIAQIITALLSGAQLPNGTRATFIPPPPPGPGAPPPPPPHGAWEQPGRSARFEELSKPAPPPDVR